MSEVVPPLPYKSPLLNPSGFLTEPWAKWFRQMYSRIGGTVALTNLELEADQVQGLAEIEADIVALETLTAGQTVSIAALQVSASALLVNINELNQGPNL